MPAGSDLVQDGQHLVVLILGGHDLGTLADDLRAGVAVHPLGGRVPVHDGSVEHAAEDGIVRVLDDRRNALGDCQRLPLLCHVAVDCRHADDCAVIVGDWRDGERDMDHRSVLSDTLGLEVLEMLAGPDLGPYGVHLACSILGKQEAAGLADHLLARVAVHPLGGRVPARDDALERSADDGIVRVLDDRRYELGVLDRLLMFGHVAHRRDHQQDIPCVDVGQADVDRELGAVLVPSAQLHLQSTGPSPGVCEVVLSVLGVELPESLGHQRLDGLADQLVAVIAEQ